MKEREEETGSETKGGAEKEEDKRETRTEVRGHREMGGSGRWEMETGDQQRDGSCERLHPGAEPSRGGLAGPERRGREGRLAEDTAM